MTIVFTMILVGTPENYITGEGVDRKEPGFVSKGNKPIRRVSENDSTSILLRPGCDSFGSDHYGLDEIPDNLYRLNRKLITDPARIESSVFTTKGDGNSRSIHEYGGITYLSRITTEGVSPMTIRFWLSVSTDSGESWHSVEVMNYTGFDEASCGILLYQDKIFYLSNVMKTYPRQFESRLMVTSYMNWKNVTDVPTELLETSERMDSHAMIGISGKVILLWKKEGYGTIYNSVYHDGNWTTEQSDLPKCYDMCPVLFNSGGQDKVFVFYTPGSNNELYQMNTTDPNSGWASGQTLGSVGKQIGTLVGTSSDDSIHLAFTTSDNMEICTVSYQGGNISDTIKIAEKEDNDLDDVEGEISISSDNDARFIAYENTTGSIVVMASSSDLPRYHVEAVLGRPGSHSPSMDSSRNFILYQNGSSLEYVHLEEAKAGRIVTDVISPPAVVSWDKIGISAGGVLDERSLRFRIISPDGDEQYYPESDYGYFSGDNPENISGQHFHHIENLTADFSEEPDLKENIVLEILFNSQYGDDPNLFAIYLNYTVGYPFREEFSDLYNAVECHHCEHTSVGMELEAGYDRGHVVLGPFGNEGDPPHYLKMMCSFVNRNNYVETSVLRGDMQPFRYFEECSTSRVTDSGNPHYLRWEGGALGEIPLVGDCFFIRISIRKDSEISPKVIWLEMGYSTPPVVESYFFEKGSILRGEETDIIFTVTDEEDPLKTIDINVEYKGPGTETWDDDMISESFLEGNRLRVTFQTDHQSSVGNYSLRVRGVDGLGVKGDFSILNSSILVRNNIPDPPTISMIPGSPQKGDILMVSQLISGYDLETRLDDLRYILEIYCNGDRVERYVNLTDLNQTIEDASMLKGEEWKIVARTWDGLNHSKPSSISWTVENTPPVVISTDPIVIEEDQGPITINIKSWLEDIDEDPLYYNITHSNELEIFEANGSFNLQSESDFFGISYINVIATDGEDDIQLNKTVIVKGVNDPPSWKDLGNLTVSEGQWVCIDLEAKDMADSCPVDVNIGVLDANSD